jgi:hypothetical protein
MNGLVVLGWEYASPSAALIRVIGPHCVQKCASYHLERDQQEIAKPTMPKIVLKSAPAELPSQLDVGPNPRVGGEADVYFSTNGKFAVKVYRGVPTEREQSLEQVMHLFRSLKPDEERFILPPLALVQSIDKRRCVGFVMRRVPDSFREVAEYVMNPRMAAEQFRQGRNWVDYFRVARSIANSLVVLHGKGCAHSDIHYSNFLADLATGDAVMLEVDGVVVPGFLPPNVAGMAGFMAPEILVTHQKPNERTDRHSLAVLLMHVLLYRNVMQPLIEYSNDLEESERLGWGEKALFSEDAKDRRHRPRNLGVPLFSRGCLSYRILPLMMQHLVERAFIAGLHDPDRRPSSREWEQALACALDELYACSKCRQYYPYPHWLSEVGRRRCPFCGALAAQPRPPLVLHLYEPKGKHGFYATERFVVLGHGFKLFADVLDPARIPPLSRKKESAVAHVEWDAGRGQWRIVNDGPEPISCIENSHMQRANRGQSVAVTPRCRVQFGPDFRLAVVKE